ncbi:MAG: nitroreductase family protein [Planctomycetes bacterium]|nr:nitroreductase family protein [Planctomycetota bacterium]
MQAAGDNEKVLALTGEVGARRKANYDILPLLLNRWSPRAMTAEPLGDEELFPLFEAARWAPSSYNAQLWRFIIARRQNRELFDKFVGLLVPANQVWAKDAAVLVVVVSRKFFEHNDKPSVTHTFDAGAAWENLALEATRRGLVAHGMQGFDYERARTELGVPEAFEVHAMIAIGKRGIKEKLPEKVRVMEEPNGRRPLREILFEGAFGQQIPHLP